MPAGSSRVSAGPDGGHCLKRMQQVPWPHPYGHLLPAPRKLLVLAHLHAWSDSLRLIGPQVSVLSPLSPPPGHQVGLGCKPCFLFPESDTVPAGQAGDTDRAATVPMATDELAERPMFRRPRSGAEGCAARERDTPVLHPPAPPRPPRTVSRTETRASVHYHPVAGGRVPAPVRTEEHSCPCGRSIGDRGPWTLDRGNVF